MEYYIQILETAFGPLSQEEILKLLELKKIDSSTIISVDAQNWRKLGSFSEFFTTESDSSTENPDLWNYSLDGNEAVGPLPYEEIYNLAQTGFLRPDTIIWKEGEKESNLLQNEPAFADLFAPPENQGKNFWGHLLGIVKHK